MRTLTIALLMICIHAGVYAQEIESTVKATIKVDRTYGFADITSETWYYMGEDGFGDISMNMRRTDDGFLEVILEYWGDLGCCLNLHSSSLLVTLTSGDIIEFMQVSETDCNSDSPEAKFWPCTKEESRMSDSVEELQDIMSGKIKLLKQYDWKTIRIHGRCPTDVVPKITRGIKNPEQFFRQHIMAIEAEIEFLPDL